MDIRSAKFFTSVADSKHILKDGKKEHVTVVAEPYGMSHFLITQGAIQEGDVLAGLLLPPVSGTKPVNKKKNDVATRKKYRVRVEYDRDLVEIDDINNQQSDITYTFNYKVTY